MTPHSDKSFMKQGPEVSRRSAAGLALVLMFAFFAAGPSEAFIFGTSKRRAERGWRGEWVIGGKCVLSERIATVWLSSAFSLAIHSLSELAKGRLEDIC